MKRAALVFSAVALVACRPKATPPAPVDAAAVIADAAVASDRARLGVVATTNLYDSDIGTTPMVDRDGTIFVVAGGVAFEARNGVLAPLQPIGKYTLPPETTPFVGFATYRDDPIAHVLKDSSGAPRFFGGALYRPVAFRGGFLTTNYKAGIAWVEDGKPAAKRAAAVKPVPARNEPMRFVDLTVSRDGTLFGTVSGHAEVAIWRPDVALDSGELVTLNPSPKNDVRECEFAPAFDGNVYACCRDIVTSDASSDTLQRWENGHFVDVFKNTLSHCLPAPSIDRAGNLYRVERGREDHTDSLERCAPDGTCTEIGIDGADIRTPRYSLGFDYVRDEKGTQWFELSAEEEPLGKGLFVRNVIARAPDDVWVFGDSAIYHTGGALKPDAIVKLPTRTDVRVQAMNEHAPSTNWTRDDCDYVFIELGAGKMADAAAHTDQKKIAAVLGDHGPPVQWKLVSGRLFDREVAGVVAWRNQYDWKHDAMVTTIRQFVDAFTRDPMNVPPVYCSLPVLSHVIAR